MIILLFLADILLTFEIVFIHLFTVSTWCRALGSILAIFTISRWFRDSHFENLNIADRVATFLSPCFSGILRTCDSPLSYWSHFYTENSGSVSLCQSLCIQNKDFYTNLIDSRLNLPSIPWALRKRVSSISRIGLTRLSVVSTLILSVKLIRLLCFTTSVNIGFFSLKSSQFSLSFHHTPTFYSRFPAPRMPLTTP